MNFSSDTAAPAHPSVIDALARANTGSAPSYGTDDEMAALKAELSVLLETGDFEVWPVASGTAANALALSVFCPPTGSILCHEEAHIERDERGAPEFFTSGGKLALLPGESGQIDETALREALAGIDRSFVHETPPHVLSLTNLTECGTAYPVAQVEHYAALAHEAGLYVHLDGARLANALVSTGASPADMSWKAGVDVLTLGLTKTGAMGCELIILFKPESARWADLRARAKRSGHMPPKMRYLAAQARALLADGLWQELAETANARARQLANALCAHAEVRLAYPVDGNEVFVEMPDALANALRDGRAAFYPWPGGLHRFVCAWTTSKAEIDAAADIIRKA